MKSLEHQHGGIHYCESLDCDGDVVCQEECQSCIDDCESCALDVSFGGGGPEIENKEKLCADVKCCTPREGAVKDLKRIEQISALNTPTKPN